MSYYEELVSEWKELGKAYNWQAEALAGLDTKFAQRAEATARAKASTLYNCAAELQEVIDLETDG